MTLKCGHLTKELERKLITFQNRINTTRKINYASTASYEDGECRSRKYKQIRDLFNQLDIMAVIQCSRINMDGPIS